MTLGAEQHEIHLRGRKALEVTGVSSVESFDLQEFLLKTAGGSLKITGSNLNMKHLDLEAGEVLIEGTVTGMSYVQERGTKKTNIRKLFR